MHEFCCTPTEVHDNNTLWPDRADCGWTIINIADFGVVETGANGEIVQYKEKPTLDYMVSMGIYVFSPGVREYIPRARKFDFPDLVQRLLKDGRKVLAYESDAYWMDIGRPDDYQKANEEFPNMEKTFFKTHVESTAVGTRI